MAFDLLGVGQSPSLYPLYSDIDSDIEPNNDPNINLMVPSSIRRQRYLNNNNNKATELNKTYNYYRSMQNKNRGRGRNRIYRNNGHYNQYHNKRRRRNRHHPKSASLSSLGIISSPRPNGCVPVSDQEFVYNLTQKINNISQERPSLNGRRVKSTPNPSHSTNKQNKKRTQKRRIRTFYSKKWGNRLYNLRDHQRQRNNNNNHNMPPTMRSHSCDIPDMLTIDRYQQQERNGNNSSQLQSWRNEVNNARRSLSAFIEEENLDLNDIKSVQSVSPSPSPSASPMPMHLGVNDFRMDQDSQTVYYDSAASNIASNTDMESDDDDEQCINHPDIECTPTPSPNPNGAIHRDFTPTPAPNMSMSMNMNMNMNNNMGYNHRSNVSHVTISRYHEIDGHEHVHHIHNNENENASKSNFKIIVSAPNNEEIMNTNYNHTMNDRQNELMSRLKPKRSRRRYIPSVIESGASDDCSSCDDDDVTSTAGTGNEMDGDHHIDDLYSKSSLFLSENNLKRGVYSSFGFSDTETDYLSAQSDDFDELTICYHHRNDRNNNNNLSVSDDKNIRFRNAMHLNGTNYLSDIGPSDIGSSDTECFSSNDSIPDSIPPPLHNDDDGDIDDDFVSIN